MIIARERPRKNRGSILRKVTNPTPMPMNAAGTREAVNISTCVFIKPDAERPISEKTPQNRKYAARLA